MLYMHFNVKHILSREIQTRIYHDKSYEKYNFVHVYLRGILHSVKDMCLLFLIISSKDRRFILKYYTYLMNTSLKKNLIVPSITVLHK